MRVHGLCRMPPPHVQHHIGGLASDPRQPFEGRAAVRYLAAVVIDEDPAQLHDVFRFLPEKTDGFDVLGERLLPEIEHLLRRIRDCEKRARGFVDAGIRRLGAQSDSYHERISIHVIQLADRCGICLLKARENLADRMIAELFCHAGGMR